MMSSAVSPWARAMTAICSNAGLRCSTSTLPFFGKPSDEPDVETI